MVFANIKNNLSSRFSSVSEDMHDTVSFVEAKLEIFESKAKTSKIFFVIKP